MSGSPPGTLRRARAQRDSSVGTRRREPVRLRVGRSLGLAFGALAALVSSVGATSLGGALEHDIPLSPADLAAAHGLRDALAALTANDAEAADVALTRAERAPELGDYVSLARARLALLRGDAETAVEIASAARELHPDSPLDAEFSHVEGIALAQAGDESRARAVWMAAIERTSDLDERRTLKTAVIESRQRTGDVEQVADMDRLIAESFPASTLPGELPAGKRSAKMALLAADALRDDGRGALAIDAYAEALKGTLDPADAAHAQLELGLAAFRLRRYTEARAAFTVLSDDPEARYWLARSNARLGNIARSIEQFEALAASAPPDISSRAAYLAGTLLQDRDELDRAISLYERVVATSPDPERAQEARWRMGWIAYHAGKWDAARARFDEMIAAYDDPLDALRPRYWSARATLLAGDAQAGEAGLRAIANGYPFSYYGWRARERLGDPALRGVREPGERAPSTAIAATITPESLRRAALLVEAGQLDGAREALDAPSASARTQLDRIRVGRLLVATNDYYTAQRLVVDAYAGPLAEGMRPGDEPLWWIAWPPAYRDAVEASIGSASPVEPALVWAIMREESSFRPEVMSSAGARGLLQLMPETAERMTRMYGLGEFDEEALFVPETNIATGSAYLDHLAARFPGRLSAAVGSYNAGPLAVARWLEGRGGQLEDDVWVEDIPYGQTRSYVKRVLRSYYVYKTLY